MRHFFLRHAPTCALAASLLAANHCFAAGQPATEVKPNDATAESAPEIKTPALPSESINWINSPPLTLAALEGKGAVLYYFEETSPKCRAKWPELAALRKKYELQPVIFIAVNSGNVRPPLQAYAQQFKADWPMLVDTSRDFEKASSVQEINLDNICQVRVITADGRMEQARADDLDAAAQQALQGAKWKIEPKGIPDGLKKAWLALEFGNYPAAGAQLKTALASKDPATKEAADKLADAVKPKITAAAAEAKKALDGGDKWTAANLYNDITKQYQGFDLPPEVTDERQKLIADPQVRAIAKASKDVESIRKMLAVAKELRPAMRNQAMNTLKQIAKDAPGTEYAKEADELMTKLEPTGKP